MLLCSGSPYNPSHSIFRTRVCGSSAVPGSWKWHRAFRVKSRPSSTIWSSAPILARSATNCSTSLTLSCQSFARPIPALVNPSSTRSSEGTAQQLYNLFLIISSLGHSCGGILRVHDPYSETRLLGRIFGKNVLGLYGSIVILCSFLQDLWLPGPL